jgi:hypothetical protein
LRARPPRRPPPDFLFGARPAPLDRVFIEPVSRRLLDVKCDTIARLRPSCRGTWCSHPGGSSRSTLKPIVNRRNLAQ